MSRVGPTQPRIKQFGENSVVVEANGLEVGFFLLEEKCIVLY